MKQPSRRGIAVLTVVFTALAVLIGLVALASSWSWTGGGKPRNAGALPEPFASLQFSGEQRQSLRHAEDVLTRRCMRARGMDFHVVAKAEQPPEPPNPYGLLEGGDVARHGYGLHDSRVPTDNRLADRERDALFGTAAYEKTIPLEDGGEIAVRTDGCFYKAQTELYGKEWTALLYSEETLYAKVIARVQGDPRVTTAQRKWAACMDRAGYPVTTLAKVWPDANRRMEQTGANRTAGRAAFDALLTQARRDVDCQKQARVEPAIRAAQDDAEGSVARGHEQGLSKLATLRATALATAARTP
ncbi:hypothetical protein AB0A91_07420 [Streptomyces sp. NPDC042207]|uniref:hypothetical protein n=1 Tax=Streptomyces sp. NPDC042207 TaxID=3154331 RepID=UPI0033F07B20